MAQRAAAGKGRCRACLVFADTAALEQKTAEVEAAAKAIRKYRLTDVEVITLGDGVLDEVTRVIRATVS